MKFLHLGAALVAGFISFVASSEQGALAQNANYACFMISKSGRVVDLSQSVCGLKTSAPAVAAVSVNNDQEFLADYKNSVMAYPDVRDKLLASAEKSPQASISQAKNVCNELKAGLSVDEIRENQAGEVFEKAGIFNISLISALAPKYYCPEFSNQ